ncbi:MAG TPA: methyltransferase [Streptosporangiaceae bacterium]|nr:methyltransferase [Streptosporangiaceae bacterium]
MPDESPSSIVLRLLQGAWTTQALHVAAALGIADELADRAATSGELAAATGAHADSLHRLLRYLVTLGVLTGDDESGYRLADVGRLLRSDVAGSERERALTYGTWNYRAFGGLLHTIRTGEPAFDHVFGMSPYDYLAAHPDEARSFDRQMQRAEVFFAKVPEVYDFSGAKTIVDVAGGNGGLLAAILAAAPTARGILFDAEHVVAAARDGLRDRGVLDRCDLAGGNFLESVPSGGDVYVLSRVLHNWDDIDCQTLLTNCHEAMETGATLLILEHLIPSEIPGGIPGEEGDCAAARPPAIALDINMMALFGGRERTWEDFGSLLATAGFDLLPTRQPLPSDITLLIGRRR